MRSGRMPIAPLTLKNLPNVPSSGLKTRAGPEQSNFEACGRHIRSSCPSLPPYRGAGHERILQPRPKSAERAAGAVDESLSKTRADSRKRACVPLLVKSACGLIYVLGFGS
jgi:hypothetical protein